MSLCSHAYEQKEVVVHLLCLKDFVTILSTNSVRKIIIIIIIIIVAMKEIGISSIVLSTKDQVLQPIGEEDYQLVLPKTILDAKLQNLLKNEYSLLHNCVTLSVTP